ncbi:YtpR family tRNA-binding protein [Pisciglobus halotolerans]|uniref:tRNA-binding protein n=1 Tax=Pisciglobus halotolerans TaxID=745365 RepID=A0A1I3C9R3_9LACT|nr:DUF4479 and tRNA-binding domain-containing protein [Pisciglobus halotolerans]SFH71217.1 tRNA-binding protein [Pisciglobus halotolerans]
MLISSYNREGIGDTLIVMLNNSEQTQLKTERRQNIARVFDETSGETKGYNFFSVSDLFSINEKGPVTLTEQQVAVMNKALEEAGFSDLLTADLSPKFVVGHVKECVPHPDSDHLSITQTEIDGGKVLQIVCGAPNIAQGQKVVVAKVGAIMPSGMVIWDGELRGEPSHGMICSARELNLEQEPAKKGILVLPEATPTGEAFQVDF